MPKCNRKRLNIYIVLHSVRICLELFKSPSSNLARGSRFQHLSIEYCINSSSYNVVILCNLYALRSIKIYSPLPVDITNTLLVNRVKSLCFLFAFFIIFLACFGYNT